MGGFFITKHSVGLAVSKQPEVAWDPGWKETGRQSYANELGRSSWNRSGLLRTSLTSSHKGVPNLEKRGAQNIHSLRE